MNIMNEMETYDSAPVSLSTGETESYDMAFFPNVIRKKELSLIRQLLETTRPKVILDYGCGGGWLSLLMRRWGFFSVGVDLSKGMVRAAKVVSPENDFIICDAMHLPFINEAFDFVVGISILHHLNFKTATSELQRTCEVSSTLLFMEPSSLNPLSAFGRKLFPMEAHTEGERPFTPATFKSLLGQANFNIEQLFTDFFLSFPLARFCKITHLKPPSFIVTLTYYFENFAETIPVLRSLNGNIVAVVKK